MVIAARDLKNIQSHLNQVMCYLLTWINGYGMSLATENTKIIRARIETLVQVQVDQEVVQTAIKDMGVKLRTKCYKALIL